MYNSTRLVVRSVPIRLRHFLSDLWDFDFYSTRSTRLDAEQDVFWFDQASGGYRCEYRTADDKLWSFVVDRIDLRRLANAQQTEIRVEEVQWDSGDVRVPVGIVRRMIADLIDSRELQLRPRQHTVEHLQACQTLGADLRDWIQTRVELAERRDQKDAIADLVDWLLERPELEELYMADVDLYWLLRRRIWDVREELATSAAASPQAATAAVQPGPIVDEETRYPSPIARKEPKASRFQLLGLDFPLYEGTVSEAASYVGAAFCCIRQQSVEHAFELGAGDFLRISCPSCGQAVFLDAFEREGGRCQSCNGFVAFPALIGESVFVGYDALRAGYAAMTKDSELGVISWERASPDATQGASRIEPSSIQPSSIQPSLVQPSSVQPSSVQPSSVQQARMWELLRTPNFITWQGEKWLFSRGLPMTYVGVWSQLEFIMYADDGDGESLFRQVVEDLPERNLWGQVDPAGPVSVYVFRCQESGQLRANWDQA